MSSDSDLLKPSRMMILAAIVLFAISLIHLFNNRFTLGPSSMTLLLVATFLLTASAVSSRFAKLEIGLGGIKTEARDLTKSINDLEGQIKALGHLAVFEQVCALNRLVVEKPELAKVWKPMNDFPDAEKVKQMFYIYCFLDAYEMIKLFREERLLEDEFYELWRERWIPELLNSETGKLMREGNMLNYYSDDVLKDLRIAKES